MGDIKNKEEEEYKRILQCPLCSKIPLIGLSMDEQSNTFIQTFCEGNEKEIHCCYISLKTFMNKINESLENIHKCDKCKCILGDSLYCKYCMSCFCLDDSLFHKIRKKCKEPTKKLFYYKQFDLNCFKHKFHKYYAFCTLCNRNICEECFENTCFSHNKNIKTFEMYFNELENFKGIDKNTFKSLFKHSEEQINQDYNYINYNEKKKWKDKFEEDNINIIKLYEHIYDNFKFFEKIKFYDPNVIDNYKRFQNFSVNNYNSASNPKTSFETYLKGRDTKYDLSKIYLNYIELKKLKNLKGEIKLLKENVYQDGKFLGLFTSECLNLISEKPYKLENEGNKERRIIGRYDWKRGDYYIGLWNENNVFHNFGEYYFKRDENNYDKYIGEFNNGEMEGIGLYIWNGNKEFYYGNFYKDKKEGEGCYVWEDKYIYKGKFKNNKKNDDNGFLYLDLDDKDYFNNNIYDNIKPINDDEMEKNFGIFNNFYYYKGSFVDDYREGKGEILYRNQVKYIGFFEKSKRNGEGIEYKNGVINGEIHGIWKDDKLVQVIENKNVNII